MQSADATCLSPRRKRGGQPGNRNRLKHGRYTSAFAARRAKTRATLRKTRHLVIRLTMVARMHQALQAKMGRTNSTLPLREGRQFSSNAVRRKFRRGASAPPSPKISYKTRDPGRPNLAAQ